MNQETMFETESFESEPEFQEVTESADWESESPAATAGRKVAHPQFGLVTPLGREFEAMETFEADEASETSAARPSGKVPHPQFGLVTPLGREYEAAEEFESSEELEAADELEFEAMDEEIIGGDERFRVTRTTLNPWRWVCYLEMRYTQFLATGTGLLISPRHVLTCSHNLFDRTNNQPARTVYVTPGCDGAANRPFGRHAAASWRFTNEFRTSGNPRFDFGLLTLSQPIGNMPQRRLANRPLGYWCKPLTNTTILQVPAGAPTLRGKRATLSGYPGDKPDGQQWAAKGEIVNVRPAAGNELIYYTADSCAGHSGSPVWIRAGTKAGLIGIHTGPCIVRPGSNDCRVVGPSKCFPQDPNRREQTSNRAVLITPQVWARVRGWMR